MKPLLKVGMLNSVAFGACALALLATEATAASDASKRTAWFQMPSDIAKMFDVDSDGLAVYPGMMPTLTELSFNPAGIVVSKEDFIDLMQLDPKSSEIFSDVSDAKTVIHAIGIKEAIDLGIVEDTGLPADAIVLLALGDLSPSIRQVVEQPLSQLHVADVAAYFGDILAEETKDDVISLAEPAMASKQNGLDHTATV